MSVIVGGDDSLAASSDSFWEVEGYRRTVRRIEDGLQQCGELMKLLQERADIEKEYAKRLKVWSKKWVEHFDKGTEYGTNKATWKGVLNEADRLADIHLDIKDYLLNDIQTQVKDWKNEHYKKQMVGGCKEAKNFEEEFRKAQKPWAKRLEKVIKSKKDYHLACKLERTASNQENNGKNSTEFSPDQVKKLQEKVDKCRKEVDASRERYKQSLVELNSCNAKYVEDMNEVFQRTQEFEHQRLVFCKKLLYDLHTRLDLTQIKALPEIYAQFRDTVNQSDPGKDLKFFSQCSGADMPMAWPTFEEYSPEFTDIARKKCADLADTGSVMLKRITTSRYTEEFGPGEYSPDLHNVASRDKSRVTVVSDPAVVQPSTVQGAPSSNVAPPPSYYSPSGASYDTMSSSAIYGNDDLDDDWSNQFYENVRRPTSTGLTSGGASAAAVRPSTNAASSIGGGVPVKALFDYQGQEEDELSFRAGDVFVKIKDRDDQGWCTGRKDGRIGLYPDNYVQLQ